MSIIKRAELYIKTLTFIAGYYTTEIAKALTERGIFAVIARRRFGGKKGMFRKSRYTYVPEEDVYICPARQRLTYQTTDRHGYHHYVSDPAVCRNCPFLSKCTSSKSHRRDITRHIDEPYREAVNAYRLSVCGQYLYRLRPQTVERSFADGMELHRLRFTFYRGIKKVQRANLAAATAQNMKKLANLLARKDCLHSIYSIFWGRTPQEIETSKKDEPDRILRSGSSTA